MKKKAYSVMMAYDVAQPEKERAEKLIISLDGVINHLNKCTFQLNIMWTPFKVNAPSPEKIFEFRAALRRYRDQCIDMFDDFKKTSFKTFVLMQNFVADTQMAKLNKSFVLSVADIEKQVNKFADLFLDLKSPDFAKAATIGIENIKKEIAQLEQIINDRIKPHIQSNILARNWVDNISDKIQQKIENNIPLSIKLYEERIKK